MTLGVTAAFFVGIFAAEGFTAVFAELVPARLLGAVATVRAGVGLTTAVFLTGAVGALVVVTTAFLAGVLLATLLAGFAVAGLLAVRALVAVLAAGRLVTTGVLLEACAAAFVVGLATGFLITGLTTFALVLAGAFTGVLGEVLTGALAVALLVATGLLTVLLVGLETDLTEFLAVLVLLEFLFELME